MGSRLSAVTGIVLFLIGLVGFLWPRQSARRPMAAALMINGSALCAAGAVKTSGGDGRATSLLVLGLLPVAYLMAALLRCRER